MHRTSGHRRTRHLVLIAALTGVLLGLTACQPLGCSPEPVERWAVEPSDAKMAPGESKQFVLRLYQGRAPGVDFPKCTWSASGGSISPTGVFVAPKKPGVYTVTASYQGNHGAKVTVVAAADGGAAKAQGEKERIFENASDAGGHPGAKIPEFTINRPRLIVEIMTYHWDYNDHKLGTIALKNVETGKTYGPWATVGGTGQGGVENAYWLAHPNVEIPAGTYELVDSSPSTWFTNSEMKGYGGAYVDALK
jgi:hypothetical protein